MSESMNLPDYLQARLRALYVQLQQTQGAIAEIEALAKMATPVNGSQPDVPNRASRRRKEA